LASAYFAEIQAEFEPVWEAASELAEIYAGISDALGTVSDKEMESKAKAELLLETQANEASAELRYAANDSAAEVDVGEIAERGGDHCAAGTGSGNSGTNWYSGSSACFFWMAAMRRQVSTRPFGQ